jgi:osomolarity two-component system, sensor histidine kinase NIK1
MSQNPLILTCSQEYLSKPLKQNQLIQTILKCATLGGALLEHNHMTGSDGLNEDRRNQQTPTTLSLTSVAGTPKRPGLDLRANTEVDAHSPFIFAADQADPISVC